MNEYVRLSDAEKLKLLQEHSFQAPYPCWDDSHPETKKHLENGDDSTLIEL